jgi:hypothetical protein
MQGAAQSCLGAPDYKAKKFLEEASKTSFLHLIYFLNSTLQERELCDVRIYIERLCFFPTKVSDLGTHT